jgi:hypothetical protein
MRAPARFIVLLALSVALPAGALGQEAADTAQAPDEALHVFMDCRSRYCDFDHFRREIAFVNYVRDRRDSEVHVLVTTRRTGSGGEEFTIEFIGQGDFETVDDTLFYFSSDTDVEDEIRGGLTHTLKLGLVRYVARLPMAERLDVTYEAPDTLGRELRRRGATEIFCDERLILGASDDRGVEDRAVREWLVQRGSVHFQRRLGDHEYLAELRDRRVRRKESG